MDASFQLRPDATRHQTVCLCTGSYAEFQQEDGESVRRGGGGWRRGGVGLVVLKQGQKVVVAVGWEVGRVEVRQ